MNNNENSNWYKALNSDEDRSGINGNESAHSSGAGYYYRNNTWYNQSAASYNSEQAFSDKAQPVMNTKKKKRWKSVLTILGVIVLILGLGFVSVYALIKNPFSNGKVSFSISGSSNNNGEEHSFVFDPFEDGEKSSDSTWDFSQHPTDDYGTDSDSSGAMPETKEDFFKQFYTATTGTTTTSIDIPRAELPIDHKMTLEPTDTEELTLQQLYADCNESVVAILGSSDGVDFAWGTGVILSQDGLVITNTHVIDDCDGAKVILWDDTEYDALLVGADATSDIAVLKIEGTDFKAARFATSDGLQVGDKVVAIGNPLGEIFRSTLTDGIISGIDRGVNYNGRTLTMLQTNTALNTGNSGGPLFNAYGQVIGITNMKMMSTYSSIEGIGFAIPTKTVVEIVSSLLVYGEYRGRVSIGITVGAIPDKAVEYYSLHEGLYVSVVVEGSGAAEAGVQVGDIVTAVNGIEVHSTEDVVKILGKYSVGDSIRVRLWRDGETIDVKIKLMDSNDLNK